MQSPGPSPVAELQLHGLSSVIRQQIARAQPRSDRVLRVVVDLPARDPWSLLQAETPSNCTTMAWLDERTGQAFAAVGAVEDVCCEGPSRFATAQTYCSQLAEQIDSVRLDGLPRADDDLPLIVGGFAFGDQPGLSSGPWARWPAGWLVVPRMLLHQRDGTTTLVLCERVTTDDSVEQVLRRLEGSYRAALATQDRAAVAGARARPKLDTSTDDAHDTWVEHTRHACAAIRDGMVEKIVLARAAALRAPLGCFDPLATLYHLRAADRRAKDGGGIVFSLRRPDGSTFLGATPETLVRLDGDEVSTVALAGTAPRHADPDREHAAASALATSHKEQDEHRMVVEAIAAVLREHCVRVNVDPRPRVRRFRMVQHLETTLQGQLGHPSHVLRLVQTLHPTPAVGGWPTRPALSWLGRNEQLDRGWYAGPLGWMNLRGHGHFAVALRCALIDHDRAWAYAGAGLTGHSDPESEWEETELKLRTMAESLVTRGAAR